MKSAAIALPDIAFSDQFTIELGGQTVRLTYLGRGHSNSLIAIDFDTVIPLHSPAGTRDDARTYSNYLNGLYSAVEQTVASESGQRFNVSLAPHFRRDRRANASVQ
jgi:hypothetical protein